MKKTDKMPWGWKTFAKKYPGVLPGFEPKELEHFLRMGLYQCALKATGNFTFLRDWLGINPRSFSQKIRRAREWGFEMDQFESWPEIRKKIDVEKEIRQAKKKYARMMEKMKEGSEK